MHCILPNGLESNFKECSRIFRIINTVNFKLVCPAGAKRYKTGKVDARLCRKLETILLSQKSCESWTWTPSRDLRVPLCCKGGCLQPRVASWQCTVQPMPSDCGVVLLEAPREGESWAAFHQIMGQKIALCCLWLANPLLWWYLKPSLAMYWAGIILLS